jgi:hypothetical protein
LIPLATDEKLSADDSTHLFNQLGVDAPKRPAGAAPTTTASGPFAAVPLAKL